jgi:hypothetical protein
MDSTPQTLTAEAANLLATHGGPLILPAQFGDIVIMRPDVYAAMLGLTDDDEAETLASVRRGISDMESGKVQDVDEALDELDRRHGL